MANNDLLDIELNVGGRKFSGLRGRALKSNRELSPSQVRSLPPGMDFKIQIDPQGILIGLLSPAVQKVREAAARKEIFDLKYKTGSSAYAGKVEALTIKQKVAESGKRAYFIKLHKV